VRADDGAKAIGGPPRVENGSHPGEHAFEIGGLLFQEGPNVDTRRAPRTPQRDDVPDLGQRQSETPRLADERQQAHDLRGVAAVAGRCATGRRQNAARLVQPEGLAAQAAAGRDLPDQEPLCHEGRIEPAPWGKVKRPVLRLLRSRAESPKTLDALKSRRAKISIGDLET
jgi:hypothetical protein